MVADWDPGCKGMPVWMTQRLGDWFSSHQTPLSGPEPSSQTGPQSYETAASKVQLNAFGWLDMYATKLSLSLLQHHFISSCMPLYVVSLRGTMPSMRSSHTMTITICLGHVIQDFNVLRSLHNHAKEKTGQGEDLLRSVLLQRNLVPQVGKVPQKFFTFWRSSATSLVSWATHLV